MKSKVTKNAIFIINARLKCKSIETNRNPGNLHPLAFLSLHDSSEGAACSVASRTVKQKHMSRDTFVK